MTETPERTYTIIYTRTAAKELAKIPEIMRDRILAAIAILAPDPRPSGVTKLKGEDNAWRIRVGRYRIVYEIDDGVLIVTIVTVSHRKDAYR